eukprot:1190578-Pyramimonas_sp.AAC.1
MTVRATSFKATGKCSSDNSFKQPGLIQPEGPGSSAEHARFSHSAQSSGKASNCPTKSNTEAT